MPDEPDPDRLRALEARLGKATGRRTAGVTGAGRPGQGFSQGEVAWRMIIELVTGMVIGMAIGYGLDVLFGTLPIFLVVFALLGFAAGIKTMLRTASEMRPNVPERSGSDEEG